VLGIQEQLESSVAYQEIKAEGRAQGFAEGEIVGSIEMLEKVRQHGLLGDADYRRIMNPLRAKLALLRSSRPR